MISLNHMNKNIKNTVITVIALALIVIGIKFATSSKDAMDLSIDTSTASSTVVSVGASSTGPKLDDGQTRDANGCITSANYVWDTKIGSCVHASKVSTSTANTTVTKPSTSAKLSNAMAQNLCNGQGGQWSEKVRECLGVNKNVCEYIGGQFQECASACRNNPEAQVCTMQCVQVCSIK